MTVSPPVGELSPSQLQVAIARLTGIAEEMSVVLQRSAFSPNIKERADHSAALFTAGGDLLVQAENIPVHLGSMPASVAAVIDRFGDRLVDGDRFVVNDPFAGGTHLNDITVVTPCLDVPDGTLIGWAANRAHHADVGGAAPGSIPADATEIFEEGFRIPPLQLTDEVVALLLANSRTPGERAGDLDAQIGANALGVRRLRELQIEYASRGGVAGVVGEVIAHGERRMRAALGAMPDGTWSVRDVVDSTGSAPAQQTPSETTPSRTMPTMSREKCSSMSTWMSWCSGTRMNCARSSSKDSAMAEALATRRTCPLMPPLNAAMSASMRSSVNSTVRACSSSARPAGVGWAPRRPRTSTGVPMVCSSCAMRLLMAEGSMCSCAAASFMLPRSHTATSRRRLLRSRSLMGQTLR